MIGVSWLYFVCANFIIQSKTVHLWAVPMINNFIYRVAKVHHFLLLTENLQNPLQS